MTPFIARRALLAAAVAALSTGTQAAEPAFPSGPMRMVVGFAAGGGNDILARVIARELQQRLGQPVVVENKPGAGGLIAGDIVAKAPANGLTLLLGSMGAQTVAPSLMAKPPYDPRTGLAAVTLVADSGNVLLIHSKLPYKSAKDVIDAARKQPGKLSYGSSGQGSTLHLAGALFAQQAKVDMLHVPYKGNSQAITDLSGGQVDMAFSGIPPALASVRTGQTRMLAVTTAKRLKSLPDVPTVAESGLPGYAFSSWYGVLTTGGTPAPVIERLAKEIHAIVAKPEVREVFAQQGVEPETSTPAEFQRMIDAELTRWARDVKTLGIL
ncbi:Bug family tripartite tricarboxylate transporter substrate binding protein [Comamonas sp. 4034]|uniref:Bug family tripartite tricarboxylate transporter substrate binding protein n=1 Tax=Comamonas sp. 4034 TaxID=3156455 RepID=UPI003D228D46